MEQFKYIHLVDRSTGLHASVELSCVICWTDLVQQEEFFYVNITSAVHASRTGVITEQANINFIVYSLLFSLKRNDMTINNQGEELFLF